MTFTFRRSLKVAFYLMVWVSLLSCQLFFPTATPVPDTPTVTPPPPTNTITPTVPPTATRDLRLDFPGNSHLYLYVNENKKWHQARDACAARGAHLVTIDSAAENDFVFHRTGGNTWLGATDEVLEGIWIWISGESWTYSNWDNGEPNNCGRNDCTPEHYLTYSDRPPAWNDITDTEMRFMCEWESQ